LRTNLIGSKHSLHREKLGVWIAWRSAADDKPVSGVSRGCRRPRGGGRGAPVPGAVKFIAVVVVVATAALGARVATFGGGCEEGCKAALVCRVRGTWGWDCCSGCAA